MKKAYYDNYDYTTYWEGRDYEHACENLAITSFLKQISPVKRLADLGCGFGRLVPTYKKFAKEIVLIEPSRNHLVIAQKTYKKLKGIEYKVAPVEGISKKMKNKVDVALMIRVMHHLKDPSAAFQELHSILRPKGHLILEFANKLNGKAQIKSLMAGDLLYPFDIEPKDLTSAKNKANGCIPFYNYHPEVLLSALKKSGFEVIEIKSVSNIRSGFVKKILPNSWLIKLERWLQKPLSKVFFGPSIFVLAQKATPTP